MHSRTTEFYNLPQFDQSDRPTWLGDINGAFLAIDAALHGSGQDAADALRAAQNATESLNSALTRATRALELSEIAAGESHEAKTAAANALTVANNTATLAQALDDKIEQTANILLWTNPDAATYRPETEWSGREITIDAPSFLLESTAVFDLIITTFEGYSVTIYPGAYSSWQSDKSIREVVIERSTGGVILYERLANFTKVSGGLKVGIYQCNMYEWDGSQTTVSVYDRKLIPYSIVARMYLDKRAV